MLLAVTRRTLQEGEDRVRDDVSWGIASRVLLLGYCVLKLTLIVGSCRCLSISNDTCQSKKEQEGSKANHFIVYFKYKSIEILV